MKTRKDIEKEVEALTAYRVAESPEVTSAKAQRVYQKYMLEVLLDIRDMLAEDLGGRGLEFRSPDR